jgi:hypothetical protein
MRASSSNVRPTTCIERGAFAKVEGSSAKGISAIREKKLNFEAHTKLIVLLIRFVKKLVGRRLDVEGWVDFGDGDRKCRIIKDVPN